MSPRIRPEARGALIALAAVLVIETVSRTPFYNADLYGVVALALVATVVLSAFVGGLRAGLASAAIAVLYNAYLLATPGEPFHYAGRNLRRLLIISAALPPLALAVGYLRERVERLLAHERRLRRDAEDLAKELENQATHLEEQAAEMEMLNDELGAAEGRLRGIIDSALDGIVTTDVDGAITDWNHHAEVIFGWAATEVIGKSLSETIVPGRYRGAHQKEIERYLATGESQILNRRIEITALRRDGSEFPVELAVAPARLGSRTLFSAFVRDLTERKEAERRLAAEHAVTRILAESHALEDAAPRILEAIGEALGWEVGVFWIVDPSAGELQAVAGWHAPSAPVPEFMAIKYETRFAHGVGLPGRVWETGDPAWIADVTRHPDFPRAAEAAAVGLHGAFAFPVQAGEEVLGVVEFFHHKILEPDKVLLAAVQAIGRDIGQSVRRLRAEEERDGALGAMEHINRQLRERTAEAEAASQAKSEFLANMSHEFRTPINAIVGYTELLEMGISGALTEAQSEQLRRIRASSRHLLGLVEDVLDLAKIEAGRITVAHERTRTAPTLEAALELIAPQAAAQSLEIENRCGSQPDLLFIGDEDRVRQILVNLLSNACKFTEPGGRITATCEISTSRGPGAELSGKGPWVCISIEDTGIGMAPEQLDAMFEPFVQGETGRTRTRGGTGLGLTISRRMARLMEGDLTVRSELGRGSCFTLWLPAAEAGDIPGGEGKAARE